MNKRINRILEILWLVVVILSLGAVFHKSISTGFRESVLFLIIAFIAAAMYMLRRSMRKKSQS